MHAKRLSSHSPAGSAVMARARLMRDTATRRHTHSARQLSVSSHLPGLSAADQEHQLLNVLRNFERFHLADLFYDTVQQTTTATIRPDLDHCDVPHAIQIDARGNLHVTRLGPYPVPPRRRDWQRKLFSGMVLAGLLLVLLILI